MDLYFYDQDTTEYIGRRPAVNDPVEGKPLIPGNAVNFSPPEISKNQAAVISEDKTEWSIVPDFRGKIFYNTETKAQKYFNLGEEKTVDFTEIAPNEYDEIWNGGAWELTLDAKKTRKIKEIKASFENHLKSGCLVSGGFKIDSTVQDSGFLSAAYANMNLAGLESISFSDYDNDVHELTKAEFEVLLLELGQFIQAAFGKKWMLRTQIEAAVNEEDLNLIGW